MSIAGKFAVVNPLAKSSYSYTKVPTLNKNAQKTIGNGISSSFFSLRAAAAAADSLQICCCSDTTSNPKRRGFGPPPKKSARREKQADKNTPSVASPEAPLLRSQIDGNSNSFRVDNQFEERLQEVKRLALQKKLEEGKKDYETIDYDAPTTETKSGTMGMATKIGAGVAVALFGVVFAFGDFIPSGSVSPNEEITKEDTRISPEERANLKTRLQQFEEALSANPEDPVALEGSAVTLTELGEYNQAISRLEDLCKKRGTDPDVFRLLGEVKYQVKDYDGSAGAYKMANMVSKSLGFEVLRGLTDALLAAKRPDEAVQVLLTSRARMEKENRITSNSAAENKSSEETSVVDPIQLDLLLGKAYSDWGHVSDAVSVYDQIISNHPDDFRGYLAKGIILRANGSRGDAERMFIQARFFAPEKAKTLVDKYSRG